jgi:hypothetical protein
MQLKLHVRHVFELDLVNDDSDYHFRSKSGPKYHFWLHPDEKKVSFLKESWYQFFRSVFFLGSGLNLVVRKSQYHLRPKSGLKSPIWQLRKLGSNFPATYFVSRVWVQTGR